uniref:Uncharacterized protein n=1 Tax=Siphoviridae sp. ct1TR2 TaxID=2825309 RepID=A0A8S5NTC8_9CAUD|nr:MAG TPA: hypothetical protein [Siphoviridae sp. ct1TR2]
MPSGSSRREIKFNQISKRCHGMSPCTCDIV